MPGEPVCACEQRVLHCEQNLHLACQNQSHRMKTTSLGREKALIMDIERMGYKEGRRLDRSRSFLVPIIHHPQVGENDVSFRSEAVLAHGFQLYERAPDCVREK